MISMLVTTARLCLFQILLVAYAATVCNVGFAEAPELQALCDAARSKLRGVSAIAYHARMESKAAPGTQGRLVTASWIENVAGHFRVEYELSYPGTNWPGASGIMARNGDHFQELRRDGARMLGIQRKMPRDLNIFASLDSTSIMTPYRWATGVQKSDQARIPFLASVMAWSPDRYAGKLTAAPSAVVSNRNGQPSRCVTYEVPGGEDTFTGQKCVFHVFWPIASGNTAGGPMGWDKVYSGGRVRASFRVVAESQIEVQQGVHYEFPSRCSLVYYRIDTDPGMAPVISADYDITFDKITIFQNEPTDAFFIDPSLANYVRDIDQGVTISAPGLRN